MKLLFVPNTLPRTMTRAQWKEADRWRRVTSKVLDKAMEARIGVLARATAEMSLFGRAALCDDLINPPILIHPAMRAF